MKAALVRFRFGLGLLGACAADPPPYPKPVEPSLHPPLEIPPLPANKAAPEKPIARTPPAPGEPADVGVEVDLEPTAVPSPIALPCKADAECMTHRCNLRYGKCAFPCASDRDCVVGTTCFTGGGAMATCIPKQP